VARAGTVSTPGRAGEGVPQDRLEPGRQRGAWRGDRRSRRRSGAAFSRACGGRWRRWARTACATSLAPPYPWSCRSTTCHASPDAEGMTDAGDLLTNQFIGW